MASANFGGNDSPNNTEVIEFHRSEFLLSIKVRFVQKSKDFLPPRHKDTKRIYFVSSCLCGLDYRIGILGGFAKPATTKQIHPSPIACRKACHVCRLVFSCSSPKRRDCRCNTRWAANIRFSIRFARFAIAFGAGFIGAERIHNRVAAVEDDLRFVARALRMPQRFGHTFRRGLFRLNVNISEMRNANAALPLWVRQWLH